ncbi:MAG: hypothetical protein IT353_08790 [Gemmatimonadaceae bacterium]|nr:hypothetical protein [Gemmatimonadaceae bacterium]
MIDTTQTVRSQAARSLTALRRTDVARVALVVVTLGLSAIGCRKRSAAEEAAQQAALALPVLRLERGACYGTCMEYAVDVLRDGSVRYTGIKNVARVGEHRATVSTKVVDALLVRFRESGFFTTDSAYVMAAPRCGAYVPDGPTLVLSATVDGASHRVRLETGCTGAPPFLKALALQVDSAFNTTQWTTTNDGPSK